MYRRLRGVLAFGRTLRMSGSRRMIMPAARILDFSEIPVIDVGPLVRGERQREATTVEAIARARQDVGFIYVRNHHVPTPVLAALAAQAKLFFALPAAAKNNVAMQESPPVPAYPPRAYA